ncbi:hypothetical protein TCA2_3526 [Paenibacillus sp. TCA20]|nr:hypothetical protein TCA2_3526 [Paenibacillus sp. TCA20]
MGWVYDIIWNYCEVYLHNELHNDITGRRYYMNSNSIYLRIEELINKRGMTKKSLL